MPATIAFVSRVPKSCNHDKREWHSLYKVINPNLPVKAEDALVRNEMEYRNVMRLKGTERDLTDQSEEWPDFYVLTRCDKCDTERARQWREQWWENDPWERRRRFVYALAGLDASATLTTEDKLAVINLIRTYHLTRGDFWELDSKPNDYGYPQHGMTVTLQDIGGKREWHWKLRQVRNATDAMLFEATDMNEAEGYRDDDKVPEIPLIRYNNMD